MIITKYNKFKTIVDIGEYEVHLPDPPDLNQIRQYHLPESKQKFIREEIPKGLKFYPIHEQRKIISRLYEKRRKGEWQIIKGEPVYITGKYWFFLNFWTCEYGGLPEFRLYHCRVFQLWDKIVRDPNCYGLVIFKPRRVGMTEICLSELYEHASRVKKAWVGIQNQTEDDAFDDMQRIIDAHTNMPYFFKPVNQGSDQPKRGLIFKKPERRITEKYLREQYGIFSDNVDEIKELNSRITFESTKIRKFDGKRLTRYRLGEFGKIPSSQMDTYAQWGIIKPCLTIPGGHIVGKAWFESTTEYVEGGTSLENAIKFWEYSDPHVLDGNGMTMSGLGRLFLSALECAPVDEFGFPKVDEEKERLENRFKELRKSGKVAELIDERRKYPLTIEDALTAPSEDSHFDSVRLKERLMIILGGRAKRNIIKGNFVLDGNKSVWYPSENGRWQVSQLCETPNLLNPRYNLLAPGNVTDYVMGLDPYDHKGQHVYGRSYGAIVVFRKYNEAIDGSKIRADGTPDFDKWETNQFVATYVNRPADPEIFYKDAIAAAVFYGCQICGETNNIGFYNWAEENGYIYYLLSNIRIVGRKHHQVRMNDIGIRSTEETINQYIELLLHYASNYIDLVHHPEIIRDWLKFSYKTRSKRDLTVATGFALLGAKFKQYEKPKEESNQVWFRKMRRDYVA